MSDNIEKYASLIEGYPGIEEWKLDHVEAYRMWADHYHEEIERCQCGLNYVERDLKKMWEDIDKK